MRQNLITQIVRSADKFPVEVIISRVMAHFKVNRQALYTCLLSARAMEIKSTLYYLLYIYGHLRASDISELMVLQNQSIAEGILKVADSARLRSQAKYIIYSLKL